MSELLGAFREQQRAAARSTASIAGFVAIVALPLWNIVDRIVVPDLADQFLVVRLGFTAGIAVTWLVLRSTPLGHRWPEELAFIAIALVQTTIGWMIPRVGDELAPYMLGQTLAIYAAAFLLVWRWQLTAATGVFTLAVTAILSLTAPERPSADDTATIAFYLVTATALATLAQAYRQRNDWQRFLAQRALAEERDRNAALAAELDALSREDSLTGVGNRRAWEERLAGELRRAQRSGRPLSVIVGDLDHFKTVNDTLGHAAGDRVLQMAAALLTTRTRATDFVARAGGDEFYIVCPDTALLDAEALANELVERARSVEWPHEVRVTFSLGVAEARPGELDHGELVQRADRALYNAKRVRDAVRVA